MALQDLLESPSVDRSKTKKEDKKGEWGPTLFKVAGVAAMRLWNPAYAAGFIEHCHGSVLKLITK